MRHFFTLEEGLLVPCAAVPPLFRRLTDQYRFFADRWPESILLFQVGSFYECYDEQAELMRRVLGLRPLVGRRGFRSCCGVPVWLGPRCMRALMARGIPVVVIREIEDRPWLAGVKPRDLAMICESACSAMVSPTPSSVWCVRGGINVDAY
jgi:DNA mismatch repair ATPase MutS